MAGQERDAGAGALTSGQEADTRSEAPTQRQAAGVNAATHRRRPVAQEKRGHLLSGLLFMLASTLLFAVADALGKLLTEHYPFAQIIWLRSAFGLGLITLAILLSRDLRQFRTAKPRWHLARSLVGIVLTTGIFVGLKYIPLAEVTALVFATPLFVALYSSLVLKERVGSGTYAAILLGLLGILLIARPTPEHFHFAHLGVLGFAAASAFLSLTARRLAGSESVLTLNFYLYPATLLLVSPWALSAWTPPTPRDWALFLGVSLFATLALFCVTKAMHLARPAQVAPLDYSRILWTLAIGYLFWGELPAPLTWLGAAIVVACGIYIVTRRPVPPAVGAPAATAEVPR